jgi:hypothetical protein
MSRLDDLLKEIDPRKTIDGFGRILDRAINSYERSSSTINDYHELMEELGHFYWHLESEFLGVGDEVNPGSEWNEGMCGRVLEESFGRNYRTTVLEMARSGVGGGLREIYRKIGEVMSGKWAQKKIDYEVIQFQNEAIGDFDLFEKSVREYANRYGHLLPRDLTEKDNCNLKIKFFQVLNSHPYMIKRMREIGKA